MDSIGKATEPCQQTTEWLLTSDFWLFLEPWHARWYEYEIFIASCTDSIYDLENERWLFGDMIDHVGIYGSRAAEGLSTFNVGLVIYHRAMVQNDCKLLEAWPCGRRMGVLTIALADTCLFLCPATTIFSWHPLCFRVNYDIDGFGGRLQYLLCISSGDTTVLH